MRSCAPHDHRLRPHLVGAILGCRVPTLIGLFPSLSPNFFNPLSTFTFLAAAAAPLPQHGQARDGAHAHMGKEGRKGHFPIWPRCGQAGGERVTDLAVSPSPSACCRVARCSGRRRRRPQLALWRKRSLQRPPPPPLSLRARPQSPRAWSQGGGERVEYRQTTNGDRRESKGKD